MKNYYKVLGLKETATAEEIHDRWIELMQRYHPDHSPDGKYDEQMAMEINEAYQVLKHSASRMGYDYERHHQRSQKTFLAWKLILPLSGLTIICIFALFLLKKPETPVSLDQRPQLPSSEISAPLGEPSRELVSSQQLSKTEKSMKTEKPKEEKVSPQRMSQEKKVTPSAPARKVERSVPVVRDETPIKSPPPSLSAELSRPQPVENQKSTKPSETSRKILAVSPVSKGDASVKRESAVVAAKPPLPMATDDEITKFFVNYIQTYNRKDIQGFLSLFSPKAIQNQKDGLEGIRRIYENFFHQSQELRYRMEDMKVEIYQNAVEVKARYEFDQILRIDGERKIWKGRIQWMLVREDKALRIISINYKHEGTP
jgi:curved DNA-binding protein CbpA